MHWEEIQAGEVFPKNAILLKSFIICIRDNDYRRLNVKYEN